MGNAAHAAADGYTIVFVSTSYIVNPSLYAKIPYDPSKDFAPVMLAAVSPNVLTVHPSVPAKTVKELIAEIKANPGKYSFASAGLGTTPHLSGDRFKLSQGACPRPRPGQRVCTGDQIGTCRPHADRFHRGNARRAAGQRRQVASIGGDDTEAITCLTGRADFG